MNPKVARGLRWLVTAVIIAFLVVLFNLLADLLYGWLDPRIRYQK